LAASRCSDKRDVIFPRFFAYLTETGQRRIDERQENRFNQSLEEAKGEASGEGSRAREAGRAVDGVGRTDDADAEGVRA